MVNTIGKLVQSRPISPELSLKLFHGMRHEVAHSADLHMLQPGRGYSADSWDAPDGERHEKALHVLGLDHEKTVGLRQSEAILASNCSEQTPAA